MEAEPAGAEPLVRRMTEEDVDEVIRVWHVTKKAAYPYLPLEQAYTLADDTWFFRTHVAPKHDVWVAVVDGRIAGYLAIAGSYIDRLYVLPEQQRRGVGTALMRQARELSPDELELATHQQNAQARAFYEKEGFRAVRFGISPPPESAPDVIYRWTSLESVPAQPD